MFFKSLILKLEVSHCPLSPSTFNLGVDRRCNFTDCDEAQKDNIELQVVLSNRIEILLEISNDDLELEKMATEFLLP